MKRQRSYVSKGAKAPYKKPRASGGQAPRRIVIERPLAYRSTQGLELKSMDTNVDLPAGNVLATLTTNGAIAPLNLIQPGTGSWNRIGKRIRMKSIRYKFTAQMAATGVAEIINNGLRVTLVYDKQPSGAAIPAWDVIFGSTTQAGVEAATTYLENQRVDNTGRFTVLKDDVFTSDLSSVVAAGTCEWQCNVDRYVKLKSMETIFSGQSNPCTIADISTGALYLIFRAEINNGFTRWQIKDSVCRLRYYD